MSNNNPLSKYKIKKSSREIIEPEEIFLDSDSGNEQKMERQFYNQYFIWLGRIIFLILAVIVIRAGQLQIVQGGYWQEMAEGNRIRLAPIKSDRGIIYDRNLIQLVENKPCLDLVIISADLPKDDLEKEKIIIEISEFIHEPVEKIKEIINKTNSRDYSSHLIKENISYELALLIESKYSELPAVKIEKNAVRSYIDGEIFSHLVGYNGKINSEDLKTHPEYFLTDQIGRQGLEKIYEKELRGIYGAQKIEVDSRGLIKRLIAKKEPTVGNNLVLSIDSELQKKIYQVLEEQLKKLKLKKGLAIAIDPRNGQVLSLVSMPSFDNNLFAYKLSPSDYKSLIGNPDNPLFNRAIAGSYPPGSTVKPLIAAAALEEKIISPSEKINCRGYLNIINQYDPSIIYKFPDWKVHGSTDIVKAIAESCNVFFYTIGGGFENFEGLGVERIKKYANLFGFGDILGIDLPGEISGLIPDKEWKKEKKDESWYVGDTYHLSIGQGDISATPLQIALLTATIANDGILYQPQTVDKIVDGDNNLIQDIQPKIIRQNFIGLENIQTIQKGMRQAVISGSARSLSSLNFKSAGKTGTAQFGSEDKTHSWFTCYAPYENPEIALIVLIEEGGEGHYAALPVAKEILDWYFNQ
jgi:penicillin-binding protein 2